MVLCTSRSPHSAHTFTIGSSSKHTPHLIGNFMRLQRGATYNKKCLLSSSSSLISTCVNRCIHHIFNLFPVCEPKTFATQNNTKRLASCYRLLSLRMRPYHSDHNILTFSQPADNYYINASCQAFCYAPFSPKIQTKV